MFRHTGQTFGDLALPENQVVPHKLQNHQRVLNVRERDLRVRRSRLDRLVERMLRQMARPLRAAHDVVEVDRKVERQPEAGGVRRGQGRERVPVRELVRLERRLAQILLRVQPR